MFSLAKNKKVSDDLHIFFFKFLFTYHFFYTKYTIFSIFVRILLPPPYFPPFHDNQTKGRSFLLLFWQDIFINLINVWSYQPRNLKLYCLLSFYPQIMAVQHLQRYIMMKTKENFIHHTHKVRALWSRGY